MRLRLAPSERRRQIVDAAMPVFARKGFSGTTTKEVAEAAKVSEGLLFKYFASKTALYAAIIDRCRDDDPARFNALEQLTPSTASLAVIVHHVVDYFATLKQRSATEQSRQRLFLQSLMDDGEFARMGMAAFAETMLPMIKRSVNAAHASGDLAGAIDASRSFRLAALLQIMIGSVALQGSINPEDQISTDEWVMETTEFILRGMGVKADAVADACRAILTETTATPLQAARVA